MPHAEESTVAHREQCPSIQWSLVMGSPAKEPRMNLPLPRPHWRLHQGAPLLDPRWLQMGPQETWNAASTEAEAAAQQRPASQLLSSSCVGCQPPAKGRPVIAISPTLKRPQARSVCAGSHGAGAQPDCSASLSLPSDRPTPLPSQPVMIQIHSDAHEKQEEKME